MEVLESAAAICHVPPPRWGPSPRTRPAPNQAGGAAPAWWEPRLRELAPDAPRFRGIPSACDPEEMARFMARLDCNASQLRQLILFEF
jgi:hypothetical protein